MMNRMDKVKLRVNVHIIDREVVLDFLDNTDGVKEEWHFRCIRLISQGKERNKKGKPGLFIPVTEGWMD
jgi:hypothetical protein